MRMTKLLALTAAAIVSSVGAALAQDIGAQVNISPLNAQLGIGTPLYSPAAGFVGAPWGWGANVMLQQSAVFNGGITTQGPVVGGNLFGITRLPQGTELVSGLPLGQQAIILPGMVGMPSLAPGCGVQVVASSEPSAASLISSAAAPVSTPATTTTTRTVTRTITRTIRAARIMHRRRCHHRIVRHCAHREILK